MWAVKLLALAAIVYLLVLAAFYFAQTALLFPARQVQPPGALPAGAERLGLDLPGGERLHGVRIPGDGESRAIVLAFGGNGWNAQNTAIYIHGLAPAHDVIAFHYRGYAPSGGKPGAAALLGDAPFIYDNIAARLGPRPVIAVGLSIGGGVAAHLAKRRPLAGLILVTPFDSLRKVASDQFRWLPVGLLLRHDIRPIDDLRGATLPVALIAAGRDTLIPAARSAPLRDIVGNLILDSNISEAGHNDIYQNPAFQAAFKLALERIERQQ